jgi:hypothetical protein
MRVRRVDAASVSRPGADDNVVLMSHINRVIACYPHFDAAARCGLARDLVVLSPLIEFWNPFWSALRQLFALPERPRAKLTPLQASRP